MMKLLLWCAVCTVSDHKDKDTFVVDESDSEKEGGTVQVSK